MVKRPKSPATVQDSRIFTVYQPYPIHPNWAFEEDQRKCVGWIVECIGAPGSLWSVMEKPKSRGMILVELSKEGFIEHGKFLGEHRWAEFVKNPHEEEKNRVTQVFHSVYSTPRDAEKDGWKPFSLNLIKFFRDWSPGQGIIQQPYPETRWCDVPLEDKTSKPLCRPLPTATKPPPPRSQAQVVGSSGWIASQKGQASSSRNPASNAWQTPFTSATPPLPIIAQPKPKPTVVIPPEPSPRSRLVPLKGSKSKSSGPSPKPLTPSSATSPTTTSTHADPPPSSAKGKSARPKPIPLNQFNGSRGQAQQTKSPAWLSPAVPNQKHQTGADPSWEEPKPTNAWAKRPNIVPDPKPLTSAVTPSEPSPWDVPASAISWADDDFGLNGQSWASAVATPTSGNSPAVMTQALPEILSNALNIVDSSLPPDDDEDELALYEIPVAATFSIDEGEVQTNGFADDIGTWDAYDDEDGELVDPTKPPPLVCPVHFTACKPGICKEMSKLKKAREREERMKEKEKFKRQMADRKAAQDERVRKKAERNEAEGDEGKVKDDDGFAPVGHGRRQRRERPAEPFQIGGMRGFNDGED